MATATVLTAAALPLVGCQSGSSASASTESARSQSPQSPQPAGGFTPAPQPDVVEQALIRALEEQLTVWKRPDGSRIHVSHCRRVEGGCRARVEALAELIAEAGREHDVDPFLLAAMAVRESGLSPAAVGKRGSGGILQLHPRGVGKEVRVVRDARYRQSCLWKPDACQTEVVDIGAKHIADWVDKCGNLKEALGGYNSGKCQITGYPRRVLRVQDKLERYARREIRDGQPTG